MLYKHILFFLMVSVFLSYISYIVIKYGIQKSISDSYYRLPYKLKPLFTFFCWGVSLPAMIIGSTPLMFLAGSGIAFVGAASAFDDDKMTFTVHMASAFIGVILSQISIWVDFGMWYLTISFIVLSTIILLLRRKIKYFWWIEILAFILIFIVLALNLDK